MPPDPVHLMGPGALNHDVFDSITEGGKVLVLGLWADAAAADARLAQAPGAAHHRSVRIIRSYGMFDRVEAPQDDPPPILGMRNTSLSGPIGAA